MTRETAAKGATWAALAVAGLALVLAVLWLWPEWDREAFLTWKREAGPVPFFAALALLPAVGFPTTPFYVLAGATFSPWVNVVGVVVSLAVNVVLCHAIARSGLRPAIEWVLRRGNRTLPRLRAENEWHFAVLVKLTPGVATFLKNYILVLAGVRFPVYFAVCFGFTGFYAATLVFLGESLATQDAGGAVIAVGVFIGAGLAFLFVRRRLANRAGQYSPNRATGETDEDS